MIGVGSLRLLLAFLVVTSHTPGYSHGVWPDVGWAAVVTFFFISGYLMPAAYERYYIDQSRGWVRFLVNRLLRIYPLYWIALSGMLLILWFKDGHSIQVASESPIIYIKNIILIWMNLSWFGEGDVRFVGPAWSLDIELQYYLLVPMLYAIGLTANRWGFILLFLAILLAYLTFFAPLNIPIIDRALPGWAMFFILGFFFQRSKNIMSLRWPELQGSGVVIIKGLILAGSLATIYLSVAVKPKWASVAFAFVCLLLAKLSLRPGVGTSSMFDKTMGGLSYPVFLFHPLFIEVDAGQRLLNQFPLLHGGAENFPLLAFSYCLITAFIGQAVHILLVRPIDKIRDVIRVSAVKVR